MVYNVVYLPLPQYLICKAKFSRNKRRFLSIVKVYNSMLCFVWALQSGLLITLFIIEEDKVIAGTRKKKKENKTSYNFSFLFVLSLSNINIQFICKCNLNQTRPTTQDQNFNVKFMCTFHEDQFSFFSPTVLKVSNTNTMYEVVSLKVFERRRIYCIAGG